MLTAHPAHPPREVAGVSVRLGWQPHWLTLRFRVERAPGVVVPKLAGCGRADGLWQTTCFEMFVMAGEGPGYAEFNLSPSEQWAAYDFDAPRKGMRERALAIPPTCIWRGGGPVGFFDGAIPLVALPALPARLGLTAVIEEQGGHKSYWALAHGGEQPDFHDPACFTAMLAPPDAP